MFAGLATLLSLPALLTGCASSTKLVVVKPPDSMLEDCPKTMPPPGELVFWSAVDLSVDRGADIDWCNDVRLWGIREFYRELEERLEEAKRNPRPVGEPGAMQESRDGRPLGLSGAPAWSREWGPTWLERFLL